MPMTANASPSTWADDSHDIPLNSGNDLLFPARRKGLQGMDRQKNDLDRYKNMTLLE